MVMLKIDWPSELVIAEKGLLVNGAATISFQQGSGQSHTLSQRQSCAPLTNLGSCTGLARGAYTWSCKCLPVVEL